MDWLTKTQSAFYFTFTSKKKRRIGIITFLIVFTFYLIILPASSTGGQISLANLNYLSLQLIAFAFVMSALLAVIVPMNFKLKASGQKTHKAGAIIGGIGGLVGSLLCCSFILPSIIALIATVLPSVTFLGGLQGFIATHEAEILLISLVILIYAFMISVQQLNNCPNCHIDVKEKR
jgi:hypothetical protein